jgi:hypothetical protein
MMTRQTLSVAVIAIVLTLQFAIPALHLFVDGANRWSWQMYSRAPERPQLTAMFADGTERPLPLNNYVYRFRYELRYDEKFANRLCSEETAAVAIRIENQLAGEVAQYECSD